MSAGATPCRSRSSPSDATGGSVDSTGFGYGDYVGLTGNAGTFFPCWTDFRNGIEEIWSAQLSLIPKQASFAMDRSSFGQDEVNAMLVQANPFDVSPAFYVIVDGFTPAELGITSADLSGAPGTVPAFNQAPATGGITVGAPTRLVADDPSLPAGVVQRFTWLYPISITSDDDFTAPLVNVALTASIGGVTANAILELRQEPNPYETDGQTVWLSTDLRVFQVKDGAPPRFGATLSGSSLSSASSFITQVISNLNSGSTGGQTFDGLPSDQRRRRALPDRQLGNGRLHVRGRARPLPRAGRRRTRGPRLLPHVPGAHRLARLRPVDHVQDRSPTGSSTARRSRCSAG